MIDTPREQPDPQFGFLDELLEEHARIAGDIVVIGAHTFAIHGVIPVDGDVLLAEFDTYDQARLALVTLAAGAPRDAEAVTRECHGGDPWRAMRRWS